MSDEAHDHGKPSAPSVLAGFELKIAADFESKITAVVSRGIMDAHAAGLRAAAQLVAEEAERVARDVVSESPQMSEGEAAAVSAVLSRLNNAVMARIKSVEVALSDLG